MIRAHDIFGSPEPGLAAALTAPFAWPQSGLQPLPWFPFTVAASRAQVKVAARIAQRTERAYWYLRKVTGFTPQFRLLVLDATDWEQFAEVPTYGITHFTSDGHLVVGAEPAAAWHDVSRYFAARLPAADLRALVSVHGRDPVFPAGPDLSGVAEALVAHELAHLVATQANAAFGRRCLAEAFANYALVAVLAETDSSGLHRVGRLAEAALLLADATPTLREFDEGELDPVSSVLAQLALTRSVFLAYSAARDRPLARWFAIARAHGDRTAAANRTPPDADHELGRLLTREVHPAIGHLATHCAQWRTTDAKAA